MPVPIVDPDPDARSKPDGGIALSLRVGIWNIEWFGDSPDGGNGPSDAILQRENVAAVFNSTELRDVDIWGLQEIVGVNDFQLLMAQLPQRTGLLSTDLPDGWKHYYAAEQKVGLIFRSDRITVTSQQLILTAEASHFAGRPPIELQLVLRDAERSFTFYVIVLHMKAETNLDSYNLRKSAAADLKNYLDVHRSGASVLVIGDWNDDVDVSTVKPLPSPYEAFINDKAHYEFLTAELSVAKKPTTVSGFSNPIDHQLMSSTFFGSYIRGSAEVIKPAITNYGNTTSDHYPVTARFEF
ncbi:MAG: endonuclease/exonuclease/phosphatase family protein [candidate division KSB1 bacterium]